MGANGYATGAVSTNLWISEDRASAPASTLREIDPTATLRSTYTATSALRWLGGSGARARADDGAAAVEATLAVWLADPARRRSSGS